MKYDPDNKVETGAYRKNELYVLGLGDGIFKYGYQIAVFRRQTTKDKRLFQSSKKKYSIDSLVKFIQKSKALGPGPDMVRFLDQMKAANLLSIQAEETYPNLVLFLDLFQGVDRKTGSVAGQDLDSEQKSQNMRNIYKNDMAATSLHSTFD